MHGDKGRPVFRRHDRVRGKCKRSSIEMFSFVNPIKSKSNTTFVVIRARTHNGNASRCAGRMQVTTAVELLFSVLQVPPIVTTSATKASQVDMLMPNPGPGQRLCVTAVYSAARKSTPHGVHW